MSEVTLKGGCRTMLAGDGIARDVTFSGSGSRVLLTVTPDGRLIPGDGLSASKATQAVAKMLVDYFGRAYGSALSLADERARAAEAKAGAEKRRGEQFKAESERLKVEIKNLKKKKVPKESAKPEVKEE